MQFPPAIARVVAASLLVACSANSPAAPSSSLVIATDSTRYSSRNGAGAWVWVSMRNVSSRPVALAGCGGFDVYPQVERQDDSGWDLAFTPPCARRYAPLELAPGDGIGIGVIPMIAGKYRVRAPLYADSTRMARSEETSQVFSVY
ncbi:MAG TPA: hypothetical protein VKH19_04830 [Gemmatimonadaceae bacterium]|nr:hypothetical protein [Gemmatimonadaceae bacterium]